MSASLVGSEMCIRDRATCLWPRRPEGRPAPQEGGPSEPSRRRPPTGAAVSYTHLTLPTICSV
eukprot:3286036-Alexandrium_andersonii.AAC.1